MALNCSSSPPRQTSVTAPERSPESTTLFSAGSIPASASLLTVFTLAASSMASSASRPGDDSGLFRGRVRRPHVNAARLIASGPTGDGGGGGWAIDAGGRVRRRQGYP